jgi:hypothetical protein
VRKRPSALGACSDSCRGEPHPLAGALVVDPRGGHLHRARAGQHLPALVIAVADHQAAAVLIPLAGELRDIGVHLGLQRLGQHPPGALPDNLINQRRRRRAIAGSRIRDYGKHRAVPSRPARQRRPLLEDLYDSSTGKVHPFLLRFPADPQVSSIALTGRGNRQYEGSPIETPAFRPS